MHRWFPEGTRTSNPQGGYVLWVELPAPIDGMEIYQRALERHHRRPGYMFSVSDSYRNFIRLNHSSPWSREVEQAVATVGKIAASALRARRRRRDYSARRLRPPARPWRRMRTGIDLYDGVPDSSSI